MPGISRVIALQFSLEQGLYLKATSRVQYLVLRMHIHTCGWQAIN